MIVRKNWIKESYRANVLAQTLCLIINCGIFYFSGDYLAVWVEVCAMCFIGIVTAQPRGRFIDNNIFNHFIVVFVYYLLAIITANLHIAYLVLLFIFTYVFFILKDSGFDKSMTNWTYVQCLAFATTLTLLHGEIKLYGTILGYIETQIILWISFKIFKSNDAYTVENRLFSYKTLRRINWFDVRQMKVKLAIRGSMVALILYVLCLLNNEDIKPNWAVIAAVSCLMKDDSIASRKIIASIFAGSLIGFVLSWLLMALNLQHESILLMLLWCMLVVIVVCVFEFRATGSAIIQTLGVTAVTIALTSLYFLLHLDGEFYLELRIINNFEGIFIAACAYLIWRYLRRRWKSH